MATYPAWFYRGRRAVRNDDHGRPAVLRRRPAHQHYGVSGLCAAAAVTGCRNHRPGGCRLAALGLVATATTGTTAGANAGTIATAVDGPCRPRRRHRVRHDRATDPAGIACDSRPGLWLEHDTGYRRQRLSRAGAGAGHPLGLAMAGGCAVPGTGRSHAVFPGGSG